MLARRPERYRRRALTTLLMALLLALPAAATADASYDFEPEAYDLEAAPGDTLLVSQNTSVFEIRKGTVRQVAAVETGDQIPVQGLASIGRGSFFATTRGLDLTVGAALWRVSHGRARLVADIAAFERRADPSGAVFDPVCATLTPGFSDGPQTNPYHLAAVNGGRALIADAAGNTVLSATTGGHVDWIAVLPPPVDDDGHPIVLAEDVGDDGVTCHVQPVPTAVDIGPDGSAYVGELTGDVPAGVSPVGRSRIWRIEQGARHQRCPTDACEVAVDGLTAVIDLAFGPDDDLYVLEYHEDGYAAVFGDPSGGRLQRCDVAAGTCTVLEDGLSAPSAITFDSTGDLWLLEANIFDPTVRRVELP